MQQKGELPHLDERGNLTTQSPVRIFGACRLVQQFIVQYIVHTIHSLSHNGFLSLRILDCEQPKTAPDLQDTSAASGEGNPNLISEIRRAKLKASTFAGAPNRRRRQPFLIDHYLPESAETEKVYPCRRYHV